MGAIRDTSSGRTCILEASHVVGRMPPPRCSLTLNEPYVSGVHAELRWTGHGWEVKDLGSRNGTYLNGRRLEATAANRLDVGAKVAFGRAAQEWELIDASAPPVMVIPLGGGGPIVLEEDLIALPSSDDPRATIYRTLEGSWVLEPSDEAPRAIENEQTFEAAGRLWRFCCADMPPSTLAAAPIESIESRLDMGSLHLAFSVTRNEEVVRIVMSGAGRTIDLGTRRHNYLLLTLARRREEDRAEGELETACGWVEQEDLAHDPTMAPPQLNIDVFRIREQFAKAGVVDAAGIIERRPGALRIGAGKLSIAKI
jgi:hypothetical protein